MLVFFFFNRFPFCMMAIFTYGSGNAKIRWDHVHQAPTPERSQNVLTHRTNRRRPSFWDSSPREWPPSAYQPWVRSAMRSKCLRACCPANQIRKIDNYDTPAWLCTRFNDTTSGQRHHLKDIYIDDSLYHCVELISSRTYHGPIANGKLRYRNASRRNIFRDQLLFIAQEPYHYW